MSLITAVPAPAQEDENARTYVGPSSIVGAWSFRSAPYRGDACIMSGHMNIRPTTSPGIFSCSFTASEECAGQDKWVVEQTCKAISREGRLSIESKIVNFLEAKQFTQSYAPDHFALTIVNRELMTGSLVSAVSAPIEFRREVENVS
jgi:hypothetical protein